MTAPKPPRPPRPAVADLRTSEVLRRAASLLDPLTLEARIVAAELRLRALWIEAMRADPNISDERRKAAAALEAGETADPPGTPRRNRE